MLLLWWCVVLASWVMLALCSAIDYIAISGTMERNVLEFADHLHEHFLYPSSINSKGRYNVPLNPAEGYRFDAHLSFARSPLNLRNLYSIEMHKQSIAEYEWPNGSYWMNRKNDGN